MHILLPHLAQEAGSRALLVEALAAGLLRGVAGALLLVEGGEEAA